MAVGEVRPAIECAPLRGRDLGGLVAIATQVAVIGYRRDIQHLRDERPDGIEGDLWQLICR